MNELQVFKFEDNPVRTVLLNGEPWFVAIDVCKVLDISDTGRAVGRLEEDEGTRIEIDHPQSPGKKIEVIAVNEPGLYSLVLGSRKPEAKRFKKWITHEVIPSLRKTGTYSLQQMTQAEIIAAQANLLVAHEKELMAHSQQLEEHDKHFIETDKQLEEHEHRLDVVEAKQITSPEGHFTVAGYASLYNIDCPEQKASRLGRMASELSRKRGYVVEKVPDARHGKVGKYREDILKEVFDQDSSDGGQMSLTLVLDEKGGTSE